MHATSSTNLASDGQFAKYSRFDSDSDRVELLSAADYDPNGPSNYSATSSGYGRSSSSRAPRNIFDDLWHFLVAITIIALYSIPPPPVVPRNSNCLTLLSRKYAQHYPFVWGLGTRYNCHILWICTWKAGNFSFVFWDKTGFTSNVVSRGRKRTPTVIEKSRAWSSRCCVQSLVVILWNARGY